LYFIIVGFGLLFYWYLAPKLGQNIDMEYPRSLAIVLYTFFGANLINSLFHVGGILHVTWSIAVEEQFYLFWAPLVKKFKSNIKHILIIVFILSIHSMRSTYSGLQTVGSYSYTPYSFTIWL